MRVKIVVQDPSWLARAQNEGMEALGLVQTGLRRALQLLCGLRGHDYQLQVQQRRMALHCPFCGHSTAGWDLADSAKRASGSPDRPRYLELLRKRG
jgi:hypothetical protein